MKNQNILNILLLNLLLLSAPVPALCSDEDIANNVIAAVRGQPDLQPNRLEVEVETGKVTLKGKAPSYEKKIRIGELASRVPGVQGVTNEMIVTSVQFEQSNEGMRLVCENARHRMDRLDLVYGYSASLDCASDGTVTITGTVDDVRAIPLLEGAILETNGVTAVRNLLRMKPQASDEYLEQRIRDSFERQGISLSGLTFSVHNGIVTFQGHVSEHERIDMILGRTLMIDGVKNIRSEVTVGKAED